jgi:hypothetical protein
VQVSGLTSALTLPTPTIAGGGAHSIVINAENAPPEVGPITIKLGEDEVNLVQVNTQIDASAKFTDPDITDTHTAVWDWGDGATDESEDPYSSCQVSETNGSGTVTGSHTYTSAGVYTITLEVTDDCGDSETATSEYVVVYDPTAGFVTGGGWINSPAGAYAADPTLTGKANFGFVSKYEKCKTKNGSEEYDLTGQTQFQFQAGDLSFHSTSYDWLVIAGAKAQYKGSGTVNGVPGYGFMLTAIDGQVNGGGGTDKFRIKIWDEDGVIYDNQLGASDSADPTTVIGGGSIVIHTPPVNKK